MDDNIRRTGEFLSGEEEKVQNFRFFYEFPLDPGVYLSARKDDVWSGSTVSEPWDKVKATLSFSPWEGTFPGVAPLCHL